ncbi:hypothetical protein [Alicyclobacillus suci]|uniref:hypothetical protein n=1 Tax=Alicyclobacillus suci TaxID=2816080 RepID=UPI001A8FB858|nr:hypothetical protein [Alicyclobacillus suci]
MDEMMYVVVGEAEAYLCAFEWLGCWIAAGYRVYGVADTVWEATLLYRKALQGEGMV